tara:strand:- start:151 stop:441 length:291 start_codon:yes stop_codon:yes gene_type:complete
MVILHVSEVYTDAIVGKYGDFEPAVLALLLMLVSATLFRNFVDFTDEHDTSYYRGKGIWGFARLYISGFLITTVGVLLVGMLIISAFQWLLHRNIF